MLKPPAVGGLQSAGWSYERIRQDGWRLGFRAYSKGTRRIQPQRRISPQQLESYETSKDGHVIKGAAARPGDPREGEGQKRQSDDPDLDAEIAVRKLKAAARHPVIVGYAVVALLFWGWLTTDIWLTNRDTVPITGRRRFAPWQAPSETESGPSKEQIEELEHIQREHKRLNPNVSEIIEKTFARVAAAAGMDDRDWKIYVVPGPEANVGVIPQHSTIIIREGIFPLLNDHHDLAFILAHELAHVLAEHDKEAYSRTLLGAGYGLPYLPLGLCGLACFGIGALVGEVAFVAAGACALFPVGVAQVLRKANSRTREEEADMIGLFLTTEAGFDPAAAARSFDAHVRHEKAMQEERRRINTELAKQGKRLREEEPFWLQTHPMSAHRAERMKRAAPQVLDLVKGRQMNGSSSTVEIARLRQGWAKFKDARDASRRQM